MPQELDATGPHVLIVDDEDDVRLYIRVNLEFEGFRVSETSTGEEAWDIARQDRPDLITTDKNHPGMNGFELVGHMKSETHLCDIPVMFLTSAVGVADQLRGVALGAVDYMPKPVDRADLVRAIPGKWVQEDPNNIWIDQSLAPLSTPAPTTTPTPASPPSLPTSSGKDTTGQDVTASKTTVAPGDTVTGQADGYEPSAVGVRVCLFSTPVALTTTASADANGLAAA